MKKLLLASILSVTCSASFAHDIWIKADNHEINSDEQTIFALDVSRSAQTYIAQDNHQVKTLNITSPQKIEQAVKTSFSGQVKEVFEVEFKQAGTYHIESPMTQVFLSFYFDQQGKKHKVRMPKSQYHTLPPGVKTEKTVEKQIISETYISYNGFTDVTNNRTDGLQIKLLQHPNKLRAGKALSFEVTHNGKPVVGAEVALKSLNEFYYQDSDKLEVILTAQDKGMVTFTGQRPGRYLLGVEYEIVLDNDSEADVRSVERFLSFEITE